MQQTSVQPTQTPKCRLLLVSLLLRHTSGQVSWHVLMVSVWSFSLLNSHLSPLSQKIHRFVLKVCKNPLSWHNKNTGFIYDLPIFAEIHAHPTLTLDYITGISWIKCCLICLHPLTDHFGSALLTRTRFWHKKGFLFVCFCWWCWLKGTC